MFYTYASGNHLDEIIKERVAFREAIFNWCLRNAKRSLDQSNKEGAMQWTHLAANVASIHCDPLVSPELESHLIAISSSLPIPPQTVKPPPSAKKRYLHVVTCALPSGGHTAMMRRWIQLDTKGNRHSVVTLEQKTPVPSSLASAVENTGGEVIQLKHNVSLLRRAAILRNLSGEIADTIILHIHPQDVIATVAFGVNGGPPVLFINHGAHKFWIGGAIADLVLNCRGSELENEWTVRHRGISQERSKILPIPLIPSKKNTKIGERRNTKPSKDILGIPSDSIVIITVGETYKFTPVRGIGFLEVVEDILQKFENTYLLGIGIDDNVAWSSVSRRVGGRLRALGRRASVAIYHDAADIYIEGFPFGSTTALLEAGLKGIPCVLAPNTCPPPFTSDGLALDGSAKPNDLQEYKSTIEALIAKEDERTKRGAKLASIIARHHTGAGWNTYLQRIKDSSPASHQIYNIAKPEPVPIATSSFWAAFWHVQNKKDEFLEVYQQALLHCLSPRLDLPLLKAVRRSKKIIKRNCIFNTLLSMVCLFANLFPAAATSKFWCHDLFFYLRDDGLIMRSLQSFAFFVRGSKPEEPAK